MKRRQVKGWPLEVLGVTWGAENGGVWSQHLIRRYAKDGTSDVTALRTVEVTSNGYFEICMLCLSQAIRHDIEGDRVKSHCTDCGLDFHFVKEFVEN